MPHIPGATFLIGCGQFVGALGPLAAGGPISLLMHTCNNDWRLIFSFVSLFGILLAILIGIFLKGKPSREKKLIFIDHQDPIGLRLKKLLSTPQLYWIFGYSACSYVSLPLLGAFWGTSYLEARGLDRTTASSLISMIWLGLAIGSPLTGKLSDYLIRRKTVATGLAFIGLCVSVILFTTRSTHPAYLGFLLFFLGLAGAGQNLGFAIVSDVAPSNVQGTALALNNTTIMGFAAILPPIVTKMIHSAKVGTALTEQSFEAGLCVIPVLFSIALLIALFGIRETFCRAQNTVHRLDIN